MPSKARGGRNAAVAERPSFLHALGWSGRDIVAFVVAISAALLILINTLFLQPGPHPAPMVTSSIAAIMPPSPSPPPSDGPSLASVPSPTHGRGVAATGPHLPSPRPQEAPKAEHAKAAPTTTSTLPTAPPAASRPNPAVVVKIQRELSRRGFFDGVVDGRYGPRTDTSIREFEQAAGLKPSIAPDETLLRAIQQSIVRSRPAIRPPAPIPAARPDPIGEMITPSKQVIAVQKALSEFGYGQIKTTGIVDPETQSAIQKFERERRLPVTGQLSHRVVRELASITGRPLE